MATTSPESPHGSAASLKDSSSGGRPQRWDDYKDTLEAEIGGAACIVLVTLLFTPSLGLFFTLVGLLGWAWWDGKRSEAFLSGVALQEATCPEEPREDGECP